MDVSSDGGGVRAWSAPEAFGLVCSLGAAPGRGKSAPSKSSKPISKNNLAFDDDDNGESGPHQAWEGALFKDLGSPGGTKRAADAV